MDGKPSAELVAAVSAVADRLFFLTAHDELLRRELRSVARMFIDAIGSVPVKDRGVAEPALVDLTIPAVPSTASSSSVVSVPAPIQLRATLPITDVDLPKMEARCRFKAEATRWAITRQQRLSEGAAFSVEIEPRDRELIARAKAQSDCFLWMNRGEVQLAKIGHWNDVATGFDVVADALALIRLVLTDHPQQLEKAMNLLAESQSALRCSIGIVGGPTDHDQSSVYEWLRTTTTEREYFIRRFMRADDPADPDTLSDIAGRIKTLHAPLLALTNRRKKQEGRFRRLEYHLKMVSTGTGTEHDWRTIVGIVEELVNEGLPPSNLRLRELLLPLLDELPDLGERPSGFNRVLQELEGYLDSIAAQREIGEPKPKTVGDEVGVAKELLKGQVALFVGGRAYPHAKQALEKAFGLKELIWFETEEHKSLDLYEPYVSRADVTTVFLATRWSSHSYGGLKELCKKHRKRFVRLTAGYNPNQVALKVVQQIGILPTETT